MAELLRHTAESVAADLSAATIVICATASVQEDEISVWARERPVIAVADDEIGRDAAVAAGAGWGVMRDDADGLILAIAAAKREAERRVATCAMQAALDHVSESVEITDREARIEYVNRGFERVTGYRRDDAIGHTVAALLRSVRHPTGFFEHIQAALADGRTWTGEYTARRRDGSEALQVATIVPVALGELVRYCAVKQVLDPDGNAGETAADAVARQSSLADRFRMMVEATDSALLLCDFESGYIVYANPAAVELTGFSVEELQRKTGRQLSPASASDLFDGLSASLDARGAAALERLPVRRKDGATRYVSVRMQATAVGDRRVYVAVCHDITELVEREHELEHALERLVMSDRLAAMGRLAASVAHEINNPVQYIAMNLETVLETIEPGTDAAEAMADALEGVDRIAAVTSRLLPFVRSDRERVTDTDVNAVVQRCVKMTGNELRHRARVETSLDARNLLTAEKRGLEQVVTNLIVNAAVAIGEGNARDNLISLRTWQTATAIAIEVEDTGCGMSSDAIERAFEPLYTTRPDTGSGIGLAVCADVVRHHCGTIDIDSRVDRGTTFRVTLPFDNNLRRTTRHDSDRIVAIEPGNPRILLVDDEPAVLKSWQRAFRPYYDIVTAPGGAEALTILRADREFDVIVLDVMMPDMDGVELYDRIADIDAELVRRVVLATAGAFTPRAENFVQTIENPVFDKPIDRRAFQSTVAKLASQRAHRDTLQ